MSLLSPKDLIRAYPEIDFLVAEGNVSSRYMVAIHEAFYEFASKHCRGRVLDAGCGTGFGTHLLARNSDLAVGIDIKDKLVRYGKHVYRDPGLVFEVMDAIELGHLSTSFDVVVADELVEHLPEHTPFLTEAARVLRDDGLFICATVSRVHSFGTAENPLNRNHFREYDASEFRAELLKYFGSVTLFGQGFGSELRSYLKDPRTRGIEWLLTRLNIKHHIPAAWRSRVRSWLTGVEIDSADAGNYRVTDTDIEDAMYLIGLGRHPIRHIQNPA